MERYIAIYSTCDECKGKGGHISDNDCPECKGVGKVITDFIDIGQLKYELESNIG